MLHVWTDSQRRRLNLIVVLGAFLISTQIPFKDPIVLNRARILYLLSNLVVTATYLFTRWQITHRQGMCLLLKVKVVR